MDLVSISTERTPIGGRSGRGFTLAELLLVLFIISLLLSMVLPNMQRNQGDSLRNEALHFLNVVRWLDDKSLYSGRPHRLVIDLAKQAYRSEVLDEEHFQPVDVPQVREHALDPEMGKLIWVPYQAGLFGSGESITVAFSAHGPERPLLVQFRSGAGQGYTVLYRSLDGRPRLLEGLRGWQDLDGEALQ